MSFTATDVKNLREITGVGMMECKKALTEANGDMDKAIVYLREKGLATAQKKAGRIAAEGVVSALVGSNGAAAITEVNIETDFAAKNDDFKKFAADVTSAIIDNNPSDMPALMALSYPGSDKSIEQMQQEKILVIGENIKIRRFNRYHDNFSVPYVHMGGKIGVIVNMQISDNIKGNVTLNELGKDLAMQVAAMRPLFLDSSSVSQEEIDKEREIQLHKAIAENMEKNLPEDKSRQIAENMVKGRMNKFFEETCLMNQPFVKENKITVQKHVDDTAKKLGGTIKVLAFTRYEAGEGIEKKSDNFAEEVANMVK